MFFYKTETEFDPSNDLNKTNEVLEATHIEQPAEPDYKLGQKDFDENELDREQEEQQKLSLKESTSNENTVGLSEYSDDEDAILLTEDDEWRTKSKHIFILSESGKPIYTL